MNIERQKGLVRYEAAHRHPVNRLLHAVGIPLIVFSAVAGAAGPRRVPLSRYAGVVGMGTGWGLLFLGHAIEGNRPAILRWPRALLDALRWWTRGAASFVTRTS
jgi:uncharacterized membrane protein YGL010W